VSHWRGELRHQVSLANHTSWRVGGPADHLFRPADREDLATFLAQCEPDEPLFWLGLGSNLLVRDGGIRGTVIATHGTLNQIEPLPGGRLRVGVGVASPKLARVAARYHLGGLAFLAGIPGSFGGALAMNAGCYGSTTWQWVTRVETIDRAGRRRWRAGGEYQIGYRQVVAPVSNEWFIAAELALPEAVADEQQQIQQLLARRRATQPLQQPNAGSVFRNPEGDHAARLIESAQMKGRRRGGAMVSDRHANFIVNVGGATAADIEALIDEVREQVLRRHGVVLQPEVRVVGEAMGDASAAA